MNMIKKWHGTSTQMVKLGRHHWSVARLIELSKDLPVMEIPLMHLNMTDQYKSLNLREMCTHIEAVLEADLQYPIILDEDGEIMDGRHRIMKALIDRAETIKAVRFLVNPSPCRVDD